MPAKPAARLLDPTAHGPPLVPGPGAIAPKPVFINGRPALRAPKDTNSCVIPIAPPAPAPHGPEKCVLGSVTVLINSQMAVRMGDLWVGAGPPNSVVMGSPNVLIGDVGFGLADPANMDEYCEGFRQLVRDWPGLTPEQRRQRMADLVNRQLAKSGCPPVGVNSNPALAGTSTRGQFSFSTWNIDMNPDLLASNSLSTQDARTLANTLYHEARHSEQWWDAARVAAGGGSNAAQISTSMGIPPSTASAAAASPASGTSPAAVMGRATQRSVYGAGHDHREGVFAAMRNNPPGSPARQAAYQQYRALPEEQDAWRTGDSLPCAQ